MALSAIYSFNETYGGNVVKTDGDTVTTVGNMARTVAADAQTIDAGNSTVFVIAASGSVNIMPPEVGTIAAGDVIHFRLQFVHGSTDVSKANKAVTVTLAGTPDVINSWGAPVEFSLAASATITVARAAGAEDMQVEVLWYVYTV